MLLAVVAGATDANASCCRCEYRLRLLQWSDCHCCQQPWRKLRTTTAELRTVTSEAATGERRTATSEAANGDDESYNGGAANGDDGSCNGGAANGDDGAAVRSGVCL